MVIMPSPLERQSIAAESECLGLAQAADLIGTARDIRSAEDIKG
jgi:hypothetical protein